MARPREFDAGRVVALSLEEFRTRHYTATSTAELCTATGLSRSSLYGAFHSKRDLYLQCLASYATQRTAQQSDLVAEGGSAMERLRRLLHDAIDSQQADEHRRACLFVDAAVELGGSDAEVRQIVAAQLDHLTGTVGTLVRSAQVDGDIAARHHAAHVAVLLTNLLNGNHVAARVHEDMTGAHAAIDIALDTLR